MSGINYEWKPVNFTNVEWEELRTNQQIQAAIDASIEKSIGDFREAIGLPRKASPAEIAAMDYCHECGRGYGEDEP
jgi:hypothetical protein